MKKLIALLLALVLCFGMFVACETSEDEYYECLGKFEHKVYDFSYSEDYETGYYYDIANTYEEFTDLVKDAKDVSEATFDNYFVFVSTFYDSNTGSLSFQGYRNFRIENNVAHLDRDISYNEWVGDAFSLETYCYLIPRSVLDGQELNVTEFDITQHLK